MFWRKYAKDCLCGSMFRDFAFETLIFKFRNRRTNLKFQAILHTLKFWFSKNFRNSPPEVICIKMFLKTTPNSQESTYVRVFFIIKGLWHRCFLLNFRKVLRITFSEHIWWVLWTAPKKQHHSFFFQILALFIHPYFQYSSFMFHVILSTDIT